MLDLGKLQEAAAGYKGAFNDEHWDKEGFKWKAIRHFQEHWKVDADDFAGMLNDALGKTGPLLASVNNFPLKMIVLFAQKAPEDTRAMFIDLYDESKDVVERILRFKQSAAELLAEYGEGAAQHYQHENAVSTYLWLRYPDQYYIYKFSEVKSVAGALGSKLPFKKGAYAENLRNFFDLYGEIREYLKKDPRIAVMLDKWLDKDCYPDPELCTVTFDFGFYISRVLNGEEENDDGWRYKNYSPGLTIEDWLELVNDHEVFSDSALEIMKRLKDIGGQATCKQLSVKYGESIGFYILGAGNLAKRVARKTGCPTLKTEDGDARWWPILFYGKEAAKEDEGVFIWKLRRELSEALDRKDLSAVKLYAEKQPALQQELRGYWWLNAKPAIWSFSDLAVGEEQAYTLYNENGNKRRIFQNFLDAKAGDLFIGYESNPVKQIVALGEVSVEQDGEKIVFRKTESLGTPIDYQVVKDNPELAGMEFFVNPTGSLFRMTKEEYDLVMDMIREENPIAVQGQEKKYTKEQFLQDVYMSEKRYDTLKAVLQNKKNIILQGAPGVGKTYAAKRLAYSMMGVQDDSRIEFVQFHQSYSYEDFMMGYKPAGDGFELKYGVFYRFCQRAANQPEQDFFFIIDEINRGNMSKIFGELLMLIERDYRGTKATLAYNGLPFAVPENLYIIGMMNTADRSLAMIDYALRRRFGFFEMEPGFHTEGFSQYQNGLESETFARLVERIQDLNRQISQDKTLGKGFCIGHSYFCGRKKEDYTDEWLQMVVEYEILPMLSEYWFDDAGSLQRWENILRGVFQ